MEEIVQIIICPTIDLSNYRKKCIDFKNYHFDYIDVMYTGIIVLLKSILKNLFAIYFYDGQTDT